MPGMGDLARQDTYGDVDWSKYNQPFGTLNDPNPVAYKTPYGNIYQGDVEQAHNLGGAFSGGGLATKPVVRMGAILGETGGRGDPTQTGWVFKDVAYPHGRMERGDWRAVSRATDTGEGITNEELPIRSLYATQKTVNPDFAETLSGNHDAPFVIRKNGMHFVQDGHHRITAAADAGNQTIGVRLLDLDRMTQPDFPLLDLMRK